MSKKLFNEILDYGIEPKLKSKYLINKYTLITILGIAATGYFSFKFLISAFLPPYIDLFDLSISIILLVPSLYFFVKLITSYKFIFYSNHIIKSNLFKKKRLDDIHGFGRRRRVKSDEFAEKDTIAISFGDEYVLFDSLSYSNFSNTKKFLEKNYKNIGSEAFKLYDEKKSNLFSLGLIATVIFLCIMFIIRSEGLVGKMENKIASFEITLSQDPIEIKNKISDKLEGFTLKTIEYPYFNFKIIDESFDFIIIHDLKKHLKTGNKIKIGINPSIYYSKITKDINPSFWVKHYNWKTVRVFNLFHNGKNFIRTENIRIRQNNQSIEYRWLIAALFTFIIFAIKIAIPHIP